MTAMTTTNSQLILFFAMSLCLAWAMPAQSVSTVGADPKRGRSVYAEVCARCHGVDGKGDGYTKFTPPPADLTSPAVQNKLDVQLFRAIHEGKPNTAMGAWKYALSDEEIGDVLSFVRTLGVSEN